MNKEWQKQQAEHAALIQCMASQQQQTEMQRQAYDLRITTLNKILDQLKTGGPGVLLLVIFVAPFQLQSGYLS